MVLAPFFLIVAIFFFAEAYSLFESTRTTLVNGHGYVLNENLNLNRGFTINGTVYICLNGYTLNNVNFTGANTNSTVYICNCKSAEANLTQRSASETLFKDINVYSYGPKGAINYNTKWLSERGNSGFGAQNFIVYNASFKPITGWTFTDNMLLRQNNTNYNCKTVFSKTVFDGYSQYGIFSNSSSATSKPTYLIIDSVIKNCKSTSANYGIFYNKNGTFNGCYVK